MKALNSRVVRLEVCRGRRLPALGVVRAPLPSDIDDKWAADLLRGLGWEGQELALVVVPGPREVLLQPSLSPRAADAWFAAADQYPQAWIMSGPDGCLAARFETTSAWRCWFKELEKDLAA